MVNTSKSTEDILKLIDHVSYKKTEGKLYLMAERLAWMTNTSDVFKISEHYKNIRAQRISPDDKDKVQLQLLMHSGSSFTFHFIHPDGRGRHTADRNSVKISLQYLIPRFKEKAQSELENKRKLCENNPQILELYRELVTNKYVCKEEFWNLTESSNEHQSLLNEYSKYARGIPSCLLATPPQKDGKSQCNLSKQMVDDIFAVYPAVRQKHTQLVPMEMSEEEFWNKFFQSHYFHRFKSDLTNDRFGSCAFYDIQQIEKETQRLKNAALTLIGDSCDDVGEFCRRDESPELAAELRKHTISSSEELVRRFNRQSFLILKTMTKSAEKRDAVSTDTVDLDDGCDTARVIKKPRLIHDAGGSSSCSSDWPAEERQIEGVAFNADKVSEYINKICRSNGGGGGAVQLPQDGVKRLVGQATVDEQMRKLSMLKQAVANSNGGGNISGGRAMTNLMTSSVATDVLTDIGHLFSDADIAVAASFGQQARNLSKTPPEMIRDIRSLYRVSSELFRHFWNCFPIADSQGFEKLHRMAEAIRRFRGQKIDTFVQQHPNYYVLTGAVDNRPTDHLCKMADRIGEAFERYMSNYRRLNKM